MDRSGIEERARRIEAVIGRPEDLAPALDGPLLLGLWARSSRGPQSYGWVVTGTLRASDNVVRELVVEHGDATSMVIRDAPVKPSIVYRLVQRAQVLAIPVLFTDAPSIGCDGTTYGVRMRNGWSTAELRFWQEGPVAWRGFVAWAKEAMRVLHGHVAPGEAIDGVW